MENWKPILGFEGVYSISDLGNVRREAYLLKPRLSRTKHGAVQLGRGDNNRYISHLVIEAFGPAKPVSDEPVECCHNDGNPQNNAVSNLRWDTHLNNMKDKIKHGTEHKFGRKGFPAKLNPTIIRIMRHCKGRVRQTFLASLWSVKPVCVLRILQRKTWTEV